MNDLISRVKGLILSPEKEWDEIERERTSILDLYRGYIVILAAIPPFASFFGAWLFGMRGLHPTFVGGLLRALTQYALSLPALFMVAFIISMAAPHFDLEMELHRVDCASSNGFTDNYEFLQAKAAEFAAEPLIPPPLVTGRDIIELGLAPGPQFKDILEAIQTEQLEGRLNDRDSALVYLTELIEGRQKTEDKR